MSKESISFKNIWLIAAVLWTGFTVAIMFIYAKSILGPTPFYLPIALGLFSILAATASIGAAFLKKIPIVFSLITFFLYLLAFWVQVKFFIEILYVS